MLRSTNSILRGALVAGALFLTAPVQALPDFHHAGTVCKPNNGDLGKINYTDNQGVVNVSTGSSATVYCPIDHTLDANGVKIPRTVRVLVIDRNSSASVSCTVKHFTSDGSFVEQIGPLSSTGSSSTPQALVFNIPSVQSVQRGYLNLYCTLPLGSSSTTRSHVVSYKLTTS